MQSGTGMWLARSVFFLMSLAGSQGAYSGSTVIYIDSEDADSTTYISLDRETYTIIEDIDALLHEITTIFTIPAWCSTLGDGARLLRIKTLWSNIAEEWHKFIYRYIVEQTVCVDDLYTIREHLTDIGVNIYVAHSRGVCAFEQHTHECIVLLERVRGLMDRPWWGWNSAVVLKMAHCCEDLSDISQEYV